MGAPLVLLHGQADVQITALAEQTGAKGVYWNRRYTADGIARDTEIKTVLGDAGLDVQSFNGHLLHEPWTIKTGSGGPYRVFTPFSRAARQCGLPAAPVPAPARFTGWIGETAGVALPSLNLLPTDPDWAGGMRNRWTPGSAGARARLDTFCQDRLARYPQARDIPGDQATSELSAHLRFGEISPRAVWQAAEVSQAPRDAVFKFHQELLWREFSYHLLYHYPDLSTANHQTKFDEFPWADPTSTASRKAMKAWQMGNTGYPIVDAGMRELWQTGVMHNRVRMVVGSFLVKHLLLDWRLGEDWFWDTLVDADPANNAASWQWVAGSGADAAPYFRIFNPVLQGEKFDADGAYTRHYVPEVAKLPKKYLHKPWDAPAPVLRDAGIKLGTSYPRPIVDHKQARERALAAFKSLGANEDAA